MPATKTRHALWFMALYLAGVLTLTGVASLLKAAISLL